MTVAVAVVVTTAAVASGSGVGGGVCGGNGIVVVGDKSDGSSFGG